jgi:hypothetical protein
MVVMRQISVKEEKKVPSLQQIETIGVKKNETDSIDFLEATNNLNV